MKELSPKERFEYLKYTLEQVAYENENIDDLIFDLETYCSENYLYLLKVTNMISEDTKLKCSKLKDLCSLKDYINIKLLAKEIINNL